MERDQRLEVRLAGRDVTRLDQIRGERSRSDMVRHLIAIAAASSSVTDEPLVEVVTPVSATPAPTTAQTVPGLSHVTHLPAAQPSVVEAAVQEIVEQATDVPVHRHRRGALTDTRWVKGTAVRTYACATEGCPAILGGS